MPTSLKNPYEPDSPIEDRIMGICRRQDQHVEINDLLIRMVRPRPIRLQVNT